MTQYQVLARRYRPQTFKDVLNQEAIITTLKNAIKNNRIAQCYLFSGSRGTGKTTLARILAKALNCQNLTNEFEPCNSCTSCKEITAGCSMDVLEIDGASNRGIDDIRQINTTVGYTATSGLYKVYIIDEVHMLTKEAFNALLKTLEEPPPKVKFIFATTEPHKVLPTILSRCQRFNLRRISTELIESKLKMIAKDLNIEAEDEALRFVAISADGGLRDAESLFDQVIAFHHDSFISAKTVASMLGLVERDRFFDLDKAAKDSNYNIAFEIAEDVFSQGKDLAHFIESLTEHYRNILVAKIAGITSSSLQVSELDKKRYKESADSLSKETCLFILDILVEAQSQIKLALSPKIALEALLLKVIRSYARIPVDILVKRLTELEKHKNEPAVVAPPAAAVIKKEIVEEKKTPPKEPFSSLGSIEEDPTPTKKDLGIKEKLQEKIEPPKVIETPKKIIDPLQQSKYDTLMQFAAIELDGSLQKNIN